MTGKDTLEGALSIIEGAIRIRFKDGTITTLHSNDIHLDETETPLAKMVTQDIDVIYRPWEEKEENLRYKEERKKAEKEAELLEKAEAAGLQDEETLDAVEEPVSEEETTPEEEDA